MIHDAISEIERSRCAADAVRRRQGERRRMVRRVDVWLDQVESMLEHDRATVPEPLVATIAAFLFEVDPQLHRDLLRNRSRNAVRILDLLFDAQAQLLPAAVSRGYRDRRA